MAISPVVGARYRSNMAADYGRADPPDSAWVAAERLAEAVSSGMPLVVLPSPVLLEPGEVLHASGDATAWRYQALDVAYEQRRGFVLGGPILFGVTAAATAAANRRARAEAERCAAAQWRPLGQLQLLATSHRLLVLHQGAWASVWYDAIRQIRPALAEGRLELNFEDDAPYALAGPWVPYLAVVLVTVLAEQDGTSAVAAALLPA